MADASSTTGDIIWKHIDPTTIELSNRPPPPDEAPQTEGTQEQPAQMQTDQPDKEVIARMMRMMGEGRGERYHPDYGFKLNPTYEDRKDVRRTIHDLRSGKLSEEDKINRAISLLGNKLYTITDGGDVYGSFEHHPGGEKGRQDILDLLGHFRDVSEDRLADAGMDSSNMSTDQILDFMSKQMGWQTYQAGNEQTP